MATARQTKPIGPTSPIRASTKTSTQLAEKGASSFPSGAEEEEDEAGIESGLFRPANPEPESKSKLSRPEGAAGAAAAATAEVNRLTPGA